MILNVFPKNDAVDYTLDVWDKMSGKSAVKMGLHLLCFIGNVYKQRLSQRVDIFEISKQPNPLANNG